MHTLARLSDEALDQILSWSSLSVATLWMAGDLDFNLRIARCCSCVRTDRRLASSTLKKWPRMLSELRSLRILVLNVASINEDLDTLKEQVQRLSPTIIELEFQFSFASVLWLDNSHWTHPKDSRSPTEPPTRVVANSPNIACWDLSQWFPILQKATFIENRPNFVWHYSTASMGIFPPTLTHLTWTIALTRHSSLSLLPRGLTSLRLWLFKSRDLEYGILDLPPAVTQLDGFNYSSIDDIAALPRTLTAGNWLSNDIPLTPQLLASLPPRMESLTGSHRIQPIDFPTHWATHLPNFLKTLELSSPTLRLSDIALLPRTLESLHHIQLDYAHLPSELALLDPQERLLIWPPNLTSISIPKDYSSFPRNHDADIINSSDFAMFPSCMTSISGFKVESVQKLLLVLPKLFPHLETLAVYSSHKKIEYCNIAEFSPCLRILRLENVALDDSSIRQLPRTLTALTLPHMVIAAGPDVESFIAALPPSLRMLKLKSFPKADIPKLPSSILYTLVNASSKPKMVHW